MMENHDIWWNSDVQSKTRKHKSLNNACGDLEKKNKELDQFVIGSHTENLLRAINNLSVDYGRYEIHRVVTFGLFEICLLRMEEF
jgi:hypothetical protein